MLSDLTVITGLAYGLPMPGWPYSDNTEKDFTKTSEVAVSFLIVSTDNGLLYLRWYFRDSGVLELTVALPIPELLFHCFQFRKNLENNLKGDFGSLQNRSSKDIFRLRAVLA